MFFSMYLSNFVNIFFNYSGSFENSINIHQRLKSFFPMIRLLTNLYLNFFQITDIYGAQHWAQRYFLFNLVIRQNCYICRPLAKIRLHIFSFFCIFLFFFIFYGLFLLIVSSVTLRERRIRSLFSFLTFSDNIVQDVDMIYSASPYSEYNLGF